MKNTSNHVFYRCCYGYAVSGMAVLVIGAILPSLMGEMQLSFLAAGGLLSVMAVGNLSASLVFPALERILGRRMAITLAAGAVPVCFLVFTWLPPLYVVYLFMFLFGIARGAITIMNNAVVNQISKNSSKMLNLLHCSFAVGAFLSPCLTAVFFAVGLGWRPVLYLLIFLCSTSALSYATMDYSVVSVPLSGKTNKNPNDKSFLKSLHFYLIGFLLFFYLGVENCVNGWFVTYLQNTGVMSGELATTLVSVTWLVIMAGRILCASVSKRYSKNRIVLVNCCGTAFFFFLLISTRQTAVITVALMGLGFCLAGIYPTSIADAGSIINGSTWGLALLTAISAMGGIVTPQMVGVVADRLGIVAAISVLALNVSLMVVLALIHSWKGKKATLRTDAL